MSMAAQSLNYSGTFVYQRQGSLEAMQILHVMDESGERERLFSLTGPKREVLRDNQVVTCILGDSQSVVVRSSRSDSSLQVDKPGPIPVNPMAQVFSVLPSPRLTKHGGTVSTARKAGRMQKDIPIGAKSSKSMERNSMSFSWRLRITAILLPP